MIVEEIEPILIQQPDGSSKIGLPHQLDKLLSFKIQNKSFREIWDINSITIDQLKSIYKKHEIYCYLFFSISLLFEMAVIPAVVKIIYSIFKYKLISNYSTLLLGIAVNTIFTVILLSLILKNFFKRSAKNWKSFTFITLIWAAWQLITPTVQGRYVLIVVSTRIISAILAKFLTSGLLATGENQLISSVLIAEMLSELVKDQLDFDDVALNTFFLNEEINENLFQAFMLEYNKNILVLRFNDFTSDADKCDWLLKYCEHLTEKINSLQGADMNELQEPTSNSDSTQTKKILLILDRDFQKSLRKDSGQLSKYKFLDSVLIKYSDRLSLSVGSIGGEISLFEIILRIHELYKYGEIKYLIINQFDKLIDIDEHLSNETKSVIYSYIYSLFANINIGNQNSRELKILIID
ncbi:uncharacterized protein ELE39_002876 [Cryptosporidium sp. chipmunk genotype I]|uniref:uncharacterized protein n=1 Tax=Cryptosporidium sp. chipmunk genotype I TaxID=1280935 RepID=UPI00351A291C|nr:hypothetical protein ELE39_002876 [Cryptosporidium sp. chipmunk genotype I]